MAGVRGPTVAQLYVNGELENQANVTFAQNYGNYPLYFGTSGETYWDHKLNGLLDEVALYNRALSSDEIAAIYAAGAAGNAATALRQFVGGTLPKGEPGCSGGGRHGSGHRARRARLRHRPSRQGRGQIVCDQVSRHYPSIG